MKLKKREENAVKNTLCERPEAPTEHGNAKPRYTDLRQIIDTKRPFSMMYSGVEDQNNFRVLYDMGIRNFLMSYHYIQKKRLNTKEYEELGVKFFIDSGAFTFVSSLEHQDLTIEEWEDFIQKYLNWIERHRSIVFAFASLDIEYIVGGDKVQEWNEKYFEPFMLRTGIPVCFVYHPDGTKLTWEQYCKRYPYVGLSWGGMDTQGGDYTNGAQYLRVAEKYNSVVHGMAMTRTALLTKLPFYTVDSTTWLVGLQYGEINYWTGQKMTRLKKDKWKGSMLPQLVAKGFDEKKLLDEDVEEMIRVNVYAFIQAEDYIQHRLKPRMYWMRPKATIRTEESLNDLNFPTPDWLDTPHGERPDVEKYAQEFNISTENLGEAENLVVDMTCFMNWDNPDYSDYISQTYTSEVLKDIHDTYINRIVQEDSERVEDLKNFYRANLLGENTTLLYLGTNFDRIVKERDEYINEDDDVSLEEVSDMDINNVLSKYLPAPVEGSPAPEISDLDDEIFREEGITPVRDEKGRFLKGYKTVRNPKKLYSSKYPKLSCDMCLNAQVCPEYKAGYVCAYNKMFDRYDTRDMGDVIQAMQGIASLSMQRLQRAMITETLNGGLPDPNVTSLMNQSMGLLTQMQRMYECGSQEVIRQTKVVRADGSLETTTHISNPQRGGILEQIFGSMGSSEETKKDADSSVVEASGVEVSDSKEDH